MTSKPLPSPQFLRKLLRYEPETGKLFWLERDVDFFSERHLAETWNTRFAGKQALNNRVGSGYLGGSFLGRKLYAHRVAWCMVYNGWPREQIDHINRNKQDNRIENLRAVSSRENGKNRGVPKANKSGVMNVGWREYLNKWQVRVGKKYFGCFSKKEDAVEAALAARKILGYHENHGKILE